VFPRDGVHVEDPTSAWDRVSIAVDSEQVEFAVLREGAHWVAQTIIEHMVVGIEARNWPLDMTGLRIESTFDGYMEGGRELRRRWSQQ
jgi:hypothetical protein